LCGGKPLSIIEESRQDSSSSSPWDWLEADDWWSRVVLHLKSPNAKDRVPIAETAETVAMSYRNTDAKVNIIP